MGCQRRFAIAFKHAHGILGVEFFAARGPRMTADNLIRADELLSQETGDNCFGHHAATDESQARAGERVWRFSLFLFSF